VHPAAPQPHYAGLVSVGGSIRNSGLPDTGGRMHMVFGKRAFFGYQIFDDGLAVWFANLPHSHPMTTAEAQALGAEEWLRLLGEAFAKDRSPALELLRRTASADLVITGPMENMPTVPTWSRGRTVLVGDSAHAASSSSGQGASLAVESAVQLARCLRDLPHREALAAYEQLRRPRVERVIAAAARTNGNKAAGPLGRVLRDLTLQYGYRIDWDAPAGQSARTVQTAH
jgi:FAD-dependent urate hydroxylase